VVHHIVARSDGGSDDPINLQALCSLCHAQVEAQAGTLFGGRAQAHGG
jgi:5-methylcytosine-specific restriction endonuclease McrA